MLSKDGVLIGPHYEFDEQGQFVFSALEAKERTRFFHLYFDKVAYADMGIPFPVGIPGFTNLFSEEDILLVKQGISEWAGCFPLCGPAERVDQNLTNKMLGAALRYFNNNNPGYWTPAHWEPLPSVNDTSCPEDIYLGLYKLLPSPSASTPMADILEFKSRRSEELEGLRDRIDDIYFNLKSSGDFFRAKSIASHMVKKELSAISRCLKESGIKRIYSSAKIGFSISPAIIPGFSEFISQELSVSQSISRSALGIFSFGIGQALFPSGGNSEKNGAYRIIYCGFKENVFREEKGVDFGIEFKNIELRNIYVGESLTFK